MLVLTPNYPAAKTYFLNGALLGFNRKEMQAMYDEIVAFAELEQFMDQKLKNYSSGMQVRLAFSIAIKAQSDILLLDEVLAVGDAAFQQKCISVFEKYKARNQTIVLVTHDMAIVEKFCDRAMLIKNGKIEKIGAPPVVAQMYKEINMESYATQQLKQETSRITDDINVTIVDPATGEFKKRFEQGDEMLVRLSWTRDDVQHAGVAVYKQSGEYIFGPNTFKEKQASLKKKELYYRVKLDIGTGEYYLKAGLFGESDSKILEFVDDGPSFMLDGKKGKESWEGIIKLPHAWGDKGVSIKD